jgi:hypothetical protein
MDPTAHGGKGGIQTSDPQIRRLLPPKPIPPLGLAPSPNFEVGVYRGVPFIFASKYLLEIRSLNVCFDSGPGTIFSN